MSSESTAIRAAKLRKTIQLLSSASETLISEWEKVSIDKKEESFSTAGFELPSHAEHEAKLTVKAALGTIEELTSSPEMRLLEVGLAYLESRALHIAVWNKIPDLVQVKGDNGEHVDNLAISTGIEKRKLARILRLLASEHIFREVKPDYFANNRISQAYVGNEGLQAYTVLNGLHNFAAVDQLPFVLEDPVSGNSYAGNDTGFSRALGVPISLYEWFDQKIPASQVSRGYPAHLASEKSKGEMKIINSEIESVPRPEKEIFDKAMMGGGQATAAALVYDYSWSTLGSGTVVDVGSGFGGFALQLFKAYPELRFVMQDHQQVIDGATKIWSAENPEALKALKSGRVKLMSHNFFEANPVKNAEVYFFRHILHNWNDEEATKILSAVTASMGPYSRVLIADQVMNTTVGCDELSSAPEPLLANYSHANLFSHQRDILMMALFNGIERTPVELKNIIEGAGLKLSKIWECRGQVHIIECHLP